MATPIFFVSLSDCLEDIRFSVLLGLFLTGTAVVVTIVSAVVATAIIVLTAFAAVSVLASIAAVAVTVPAVSALTTVAILAGDGVTLRLDITLGLFGESPHGESHLAGLLVNLEKLDIDLVTDLEHV